MHTGRAPRYVKQYGAVGDQITAAVASYCSEVRGGQFPDREHSYLMERAELARFRERLNPSPRRGRIRRRRRPAPTRPRPAADSDAYRFPCRRRAIARGRRWRAAWGWYPPWAPCTPATPLWSGPAPPSAGNRGQHLREPHALERPRRPGRLSARPGPRSRPARRARRRPGMDAAPGRGVSAGFQTYVEVRELSRPLEGVARRDHFTGVATVVPKLLLLFRRGVPTSAARMRSSSPSCAASRPISGCRPPSSAALPCAPPTAWALSSRNELLTDAGRRRAAALYRGLRAAGAAGCRGNGAVRRCWT